MNTQSPTHHETSSSMSDPVLLAAGQDAPHATGRRRCVPPITVQSMTPNATPDLLPIFRLSWWWDRSTRWLRGPSWGDVAVTTFARRDAGATAVRDR